MKKTFTILAFIASYLIYSQGIQALDGSNIFYRYATVYDWDCCLLGPGYNDGQPYNYPVDGHFKVMYDDFGHGTVVESTGSYASINPVGSSYNSSFGTSSYPDYKSLTVNSQCCNEFGDKIYVKLSEPITLSTENDKRKSFKIYPNPITDFIKIQKSENLKIIKTEIFDTNGKLIDNFKIENDRINVESLPKGIYFLKILSVKGTENLKFIKK